MNVACPQCTSVFRVDPSKVPAGGVRARCSVCSGVINVPEPVYEQPVSAGAGAGWPAETPPDQWGRVDTPAGGWTAPPPSAAEAPAAPAPPQPNEPVMPPQGAHTAMWQTPPMPSSADWGGWQAQSAPFSQPRDAPPAAQQPASDPWAGFGNNPLSPEVPNPAYSAPASYEHPPAEPTPLEPASPEPIPLEPRPFESAPADPRTNERAALDEAPRTERAHSELQQPDAGAESGRPDAQAEASADEHGGQPVAEPLHEAEPAQSARPQAEPALEVPQPARQGASGEAASTHVNPFLRRDPHERARRLARALASDIVVYYPDKHAEGVRDGNLRELFREEIKKSYDDYVAQVGADIAESTTYFQEALNEILAGGKRLF